MIVYTTSAICVSHLYTAIHYMLSTVVRCVCVCASQHVLLGYRYGYGETVRRRYTSRSPEWLVTLPTPESHLYLCVCVYELSLETCSHAEFDDCALAPKCIDNLS